MDIRVLLKHGWLLIQEHTPEILTGAAVAGTVASVFLTAKNTPKAVRLIDEAQQAKGQEPLTLPEKAKACWKVYIPTGVTAGASILCMIASTRTSLKRNAALLGLYSVSQEAISEYQKKVVDVIGEKKEQAIRDEVNAEKLQRITSSGTEFYAERTGYGDELFRDSLTGVLFYSDINAVKRAANEANYDMQHGFYQMSFNEWYGRLGLKNIDIGDQLYFNAEHLIDLSYGSTLLDERKSAVTIGYYDPPSEKYKH